MKKAAIIAIFIALVLALISEARFKGYTNGEKIASLEASTKGDRALLTEVHKDVREIRKFIMRKK